MAGLLLCVLASNAQVQIIQLPSSPLRFTLADWQSFQVVYAGDQPMEVLVSGTLGQGRASNVLASYKSTAVILQPGVNVLSPTTLKLADLQFVGSTAAGLRSGKSLNPGSYLSCITVNSKEGKELGSSCLEIGISPISGPILIYPSNESVITESQPMFNWLPVVMEGSSDEIAYELSLYEVANNQSILEAASRNRSIFRQRVQGRPQLSYPSDAQPLEMDRGYVWQVKAFYMGQSIGNSEYFSFKLGAQVRLGEVPDTVLIRLDPHKMSPMAHCNNVLQLSFKHYVPNEQMQVVLKSRTGKRMVLKADQISKVGPHGALYINLAELDFLHEGQYYSLECIRQNNQVLTAHLAYKCR